MSRKLDTFEKVKKAIDEMKADLKKQQAAEVVKKAWQTTLKWLSFSFHRNIGL